MFELEFIGSVSDLPVAEVRDLLQETQSRNIFHEPELIRAGLGLPEAAGFVALLVWRRPASGKSVLEGLIPMTRRRSISGRVQWSSWHHRHCYLGEPAIRRGSEHHFWRALLTSLDEQSRPFGFIRLNGLDGDSASTAALLEVVAEEGRPLRWRERSKRALLRGGCSSADYLKANVRKKKTKELRRLHNRLAEQGTLAVKSVDTEDHTALAQAVDGYLLMEADGWKGRCDTAAHCDDKDESYFRQMTSYLAGQRRLQIMTLDLDRCPIAYLVTALTQRDDDDEGRRGAYTLKTTYNEKLSKYSPGVLLQLAFMERALDVDHLDWVDSCAQQGHPMIDHLWSDRRAIVSLSAALGGAASDAVMRLENGLLHTARASMRTPWIHAKSYAAKLRGSL